jgi:hypothetical protein
MRPGGTPGCRRPARTDSVSKPTPGKWCRAFLRRSEGVKERQKAEKRDAVLLDGQ